METTLFRLNPWWAGKYRIDAVARPKYVDALMASMRDDRVTFLVGLRRVGKTTLLKCAIEKLQETIDPTRILFVPLDHPVFLSSSLGEIVEAFRILQGIPFEEKVYLFFDEVQARENFEVELKAIADSERVKVFCSGSQSLLLKDKKARLTGRTQTIVVYPLSFAEFLLFRKASFSQANSHLYAKYFEEYLELGGIPRYVLEGDPQYVIELVDAIITKDIVSFHGLKNANVVKELFLLLCERAGKRVSFNKLANVLSLPVESVRQYVSFMEEAFLIHTVYRKTRTLNERIKSNRKVYIADVGIRNVMTGFKDKGAVFENLAFLRLQDSKPAYYYENGAEIDFVFADTAVECKYKEKIGEEELEALKSSRFTNKVVARNYAFFLDEEKGRAGMTARRRQNQ
ncbi:MAG: ATP-binding protein [Candidatus Micrarchaeota archaeon]